MNPLHHIILLLSLLAIVYGDDSDVQEEEDMSYFLERLYEEPDDGFAPYDMLNYPGQKKPPENEGKRNMFASDYKTNDHGSCNFDRLKWAEGMNQLQVCQDALESVNHNLEIDRQKIRNMEKRLTKEVSVDMMAFYRRVIHHLWHVLELKEASNVLTEADNAIFRRLTVHISKEDINELQHFLDHQDNVQQVDKILQDAFVLDKFADVDHKFSVKAMMSSIFSFVELGKNVEVWLYTLCFGFLLLGIWAVYLFIRDVQRELRWMRVVMMMVVLIFFICCLWHWRHLHKIAESRRHAQMLKRGFNNIPEECQPGGQGTTSSVWEWIKVRALGAPDVCEKYFEELMIDPSEEITPGMVIAETLAKFFFHPLQHLGSESAKFISNFYNVVPLVYHVQATVVFIILLIIILFAFCGYGIDFPFWLGGIRPIYRTETADTSDVDRITKEAIAQLKNDREKFMVESRMMLTDITKAATSSQAQAGMQPLLMMSSSIIESQLERLIARQLSGVLPQTLDDSAVNGVLSRQHTGQWSPSLRNSEDVFTVTSTPLRDQLESRRSNSDSCSSEDVRDGICMGKNTRSSALVATTDAVHYRLTGTPRQKELPPKGGIKSSSVVTGDNSGRSDLSAETSFDNKDVVSVVRRQGVGQTNNDSRPSTSYSDLSLNQSLHNDSESEGNFFNKVKSILEESANSSMNCENSDVSEDHSRRGSLGRYNRTQSEEIELSASGVKFITNIEKVMTP